MGGIEPVGTSVKKKVLNALFFSESAKDAGELMSERV